MAATASGSRRPGPVAGRVRAAARAPHGRRIGPVNTRRAAILALVICALALTVAAPLRTYLGQRSKIAEQRATEQQLTTRLHRLRHRQALLSDPHYVRTQARKRLLYVAPGATPYLVAPRDGGTGSAGHTPAGRHDHARDEKSRTSRSGSGG
jgi:cell division protein FtsB